METARPNWGRIKIELLRIVEQEPTSKADKRNLLTLAEIVGQGELTDLIEGYLKYVKQLTGSTTFVARESADIVRRFDSQFFDKCDPFDFVQAAEKYRFRRDDPEVNAKLIKWAEELPELLKRVRRESLALREWNLPDFPGAIVELVKVMCDLEKKDAVPAEVRMIVDHVRCGRIAIGAIPAPPLITIHFPMRMEAYPEVMTEERALEYLREVHATDVSGTTLGNRAKEDGNEYMRPPQGSGYLRDGLDRAVKQGVFGRRGVRDTLRRAR
jgi:hypothetical protein